jgi:hypothetical protein
MSLSLLFKFNMNTYIKLLQITEYGLLWKMPSVNGRNRENVNSRKSRKSNLFVSFDYNISVLYNFNLFRFFFRIKFKFRTTTF